MAGLETATTLSATTTLMPCPLCRGAEHTVVGTQDRHGRPLQTTLCTSCGHVFTNPLPTAEAMAAYYGKDYRRDYKGITTPKPKHVYRAGLRALERFERLIPFVQPGSTVIDVGAGGGEFLHLLNTRGYRAAGIEPNEGYGAHARASYGLDVRAGTLEQISFPPEAADAVTLHHVLEHLVDPLAGLKRIREWLKPGGLLFIEVPNIESRYHAPQRRFHLAHLHTFSAGGLEDTARNAGYAVEDIVLMPHTGHINLIARRVEDAAAPQWRNAATRVAAFLRSHTPLSHLLSGQGLRRLWGNARRPLREKAALNQLNNPRTARDVLDRLYAEAPARTPH